MYLRGNLLTFPSNQAKASCRQSLASKKFLRAIFTLMFLDVFCLGLPLSLEIRLGKRSSHGLCVMMVMHLRSQSHCSAFALNVQKSQVPMTTIGALQFWSSTARKVHQRRL